MRHEVDMIHQRSAALPRTGCSTASRRTRYERTSHPPGFDSTYGACQRQ